MSISRFFVACMLGGAAFALSGCASIITQGDQEVAVTTPMIEAAECSLSNARGNWTVTTPGRVEVVKSKTDLQIRCSKTGVPDTETVAKSGFEPWTLGNILIGGLIGLGIDWATGAIHKYPSDIEVPMGQPPVGSDTTKSPVTTSNNAPTS